MWVRRAAIRKIPSYARVPSHVLDAVRDGFAEDDEQARAQLDDAFQRFEETQPALSAKVSDVLGRPLDETALALGYFLTLATWLAFERTHGDQLGEVLPTEAAAASELLELDEKLKMADPDEPLETDDVISMEQPDLMGFVHEHLDATLESHAQHIDVDDVSQVYKLVLSEVLALSYAVARPRGFPVTKLELLA
jgi:hypothetical protein